MENKIKFAEIIKTEKDEGKEKHIPHMEITKGYKTGKDIVRVVEAMRLPIPTQLSTILPGLNSTG